MKSLLVRRFADDRANLEEECADAIAWLCTLANISDVDLTAALTKKHLGEDRPQGHEYRQNRRRASRLAADSFQLSQRIRC
jgi:NTP pyrophosphatase (non-canonical NTP hydrolase)